jgi:hypothetical protein
MAQHVADAALKPILAVMPALDQLAEASNGERRAPLGNKNEGRLDVTFQSPQYPRLTQAFLVTNLK